MGVYIQCVAHCEGGTVSNACPYGSEAMVAVAPNEVDISIRDGGSVRFEIEVVPDGWGRANYRLLCPQCLKEVQEKK